MNDKERLEVLELLASGKLSAQQAAELLRQADMRADESSAGESSPIKGTGESEAAEPVYKAGSDIRSEQDLSSEVIPWPDDDYKTTEGKPRWLRIRVQDMHSQRNRVTVNVPLWLVSFGLGAARRIGADLGGFEPDMLNAMVNEGRRGVLVDVQDEEDGERVQIYLD